MKETLEYLGQGVRNFIDWCRRFVLYYGVVLFLFGFSLVGFVEFTKLYDTGLSEQILRYWVPSSAGVVVSLPLAELVRQYISDPPREILHEVDPEEGDFGVKYLSPGQWEELTVVDVVRADDGSLVELERDKADLHRVQANVEEGEETAYECEFYDPEENQAYVSWFGKDDVSGTEIRRHRDSAEYLKLEASAEKDVHQRLRNLYPEIVEAAVHDRLNYYIHVVEGETIPGEESIRSLIDRKIRDTELQQYVEEDGDWDDLVDKENPFEQESLARQFIKQQQEGEDDE